MYSDADVFHFNRFKVWRFAGVPNEFGVITAVKAKLLCEDMPILEAVAELGSPDPALVEKFRNRNPEHGMYLFRHNDDDDQEKGFLAADRVEPKHLAAWAWAHLDKDALEAEGLARWWEILAARRGQKEPEPPPSPAKSQPEDVIPDTLQRFAEADESPDDFRNRAFRLLQRFGIEEGKHGPDTPALSVDEKIQLIPMLIANFEAGNWLNLSADLKPKD